MGLYSDNFTIILYAHFQSGPPRGGGGWGSTLSGPPDQKGPPKKERKKGRPGPAQPLGGPVFNMRDVSTII